jgi:quinol monooxygenase YgiN
MVWEIAQIEVRPGTDQSFEEAVRQVRPLFEQAAGCHGVQLRRSAEYPQRYRLVVEWETVEHHTMDFHRSPDYQRWRELVGGYFAAPPQVKHVYPVTLT